MCWNARPSGETVQIDQLREPDVRVPETTKHLVVKTDGQVFLWDSITNHRTVGTGIFARDTSSEIYQTTCRTDKSSPGTPLRITRGQTTCRSCVKWGSTNHVSASVGASPLNFTLNVCAEYFHIMNADTLMFIM